MAGKMEAEGQEVIDTENLALGVSETTYTFGYGRRDHDGVVSINRENVDDNYIDSIIFPFVDICGETYNANEQGSTAWVRVTDSDTCLNRCQWTDHYSNYLSLVVGSNANQWEAMVASCC